MFYYGVKIQLATTNMTVPCHSEEQAKTLHTFVEKLKLTAFILFNTEPIQETVIPHKPSYLRYYECDCGCDITDHDGRVTITRCWTDECCDPEACLAHPNLFIREYSIDHGIKSYK